MDRVTDISVRKKNGSLLVPITSHKQKIREAKRMFIFPHGTWEDNIRSVILDWKQRPTGHSNKYVSSPVCVLRPSSYFTKSFPATEERYVRTLSLTLFLLHKTSQSKNKNITYNFHISTSSSLFVQQCIIRHDNWALKWYSCFCFRTLLTTIPW